MKDQKSSQSHDRQLILSLPVCLFVTPTSQHASHSMCAALVVFVWLVRPVRLPCILLSPTSQKHHFILWLCVCHPGILNDECGRGTVRLSPPSWCCGLPSPPVSLLFLSPKCCLGGFGRNPVFTWIWGISWIMGTEKAAFIAFWRSWKKNSSTTFCTRACSGGRFFLNLFLCYNCKITVTSQEIRNSFRQ